MAKNVYLLEKAATLLSSLVDELVFIGGATLGLMVTDEGASPIRGTLDVDVIAEITTYAEYVVLAERLKVLGFSEDTREAAPVCRWVKGDLTLDVLPLIEVMLGFNTEWYRAAHKAAEPALLPNGLVYTAHYGAFLPKYQDGGVPRTRRRRFQFEP